MVAFTYVLPIDFFPYLNILLALKGQRTRCARPLGRRNSATQLALFEGSLHHCIPSADAEGLAGEVRTKTLLLPDIPRSSISGLGALRHMHYEYQILSIVYFVDNPIISHPYSIGPFGSLNLPYPMGTWVISQTSYGNSQPIKVTTLYATPQPLQIAVGSRRDLEFIHSQTLSPYPV